MPNKVLQICALAVSVILFVACSLPSSYPVTYLLPHPLASFDNDGSDIEKSLGKLNEAMNGVAKTVDNVDRRLGDVRCRSSCSDTSKMPILTKQILSIDSRVRTLDESISSVAKSVAEVTRRVADMSLRLQSGEQGMVAERISKVEGRVEALAQEINGVASTVADGNQKLSDAVCTLLLSSSASDLSKAISSVCSIEARVEKLEQAFKEEPLPPGPNSGSKSGMGILIGLTVFLALVGIFLGWQREGNGQWRLPWKWPFSRQSDYENNGESLAECSEEISEGYRHYSKLRFAVFTLFLSVNGALGVLYFGKEFRATTMGVHDLIPWGGVILTIVCLWMEVTIDIIQTEFYYMARAAQRWRERRRTMLLPVPSGPASALGMRADRVSNSNRYVRFPIWLLYGFVAGVWTQILCNYYRGA